MQYTTDIVRLKEVGAEEKHRCAGRMRIQRRSRESQRFSTIDHNYLKQRTHANRARANTKRNTMQCGEVTGISSARADEAQVSLTTDDWYTGEGERAREGVDIWAFK